MAEHERERGETPAKLKSELSPREAADRELPRSGTFDEATSRPFERAGEQAGAGESGWSERERGGGAYGEAYDENFYGAGFGEFDERYEGGRGREESGGGLFTEPAFYLGIGVGVGIGITLAAIFSPRRGAARRAYVKDKFRAGLREARVGAERKARDAANRVRGAAHEAKARMTEDEVPDDILAERVRAQLGRPVSHPGALHVAVRDGCVFVSGNILAQEVDDLLKTISRVRGVRGLENRLTIHAEPGNIPDLQGPGSRQTH